MDSLLLRVLLFPQPFFVEGLLVVDRTVFINGRSAEVVSFLIRENFGVF